MIFHFLTFSIFLLRIFGNQVGRCRLLLASRSFNWSVSISVSVSSRHRTLLAVGLGGVFVPFVNSENFINFLFFIFFVCLFWPFSYFSDCLGRNVDFISQLSQWDDRDSNSWSLTSSWFDFQWPTFWSNFNQ